MERASSNSWPETSSEPNPKTAHDGVAGYELALNYCGVPFRVIPRTPAEMKTTARPCLVSVNAREQALHPCRNLVVREGGTWVLGHQGERLLDLLTY